MENPVNEAFVSKWKAYAKAKNLPGADKAVTNDPMEATYVGIHMWAQAVEKAGSTEVDKVRDALAGQTFKAPSGYTLTMDKIREIAVLKLIGTRNRTIAAMIMQQALALGVIGFVVGKITATFAAPLFPKYVLLIPFDSVAGFFAVMVICLLASIVAIRMALKVDPAEAIGG